MSETWLKWLEEDEVKSFELIAERHGSASPVLLGRGNDMDVRIDDVDASRRHAFVYCLRGAWYIEDESTNGTVLRRGEQSSVVSQRRVRMRDGDLLEVGAWQIRFNTDLVEDGIPTRTNVRAPVMRLTPMEANVLEEIGRNFRSDPGLIPSNKEIIEALSISPAYLSKCLTSLYLKFDIRDDVSSSSKRTLLVERAGKLGYI